MVSHVDAARSVVGVDIGGTRTKAVALALLRASDGGAAPAAAMVLAEAVVPTPTTVGADLGAHVAHVLEQLGDKAGAPAALGVVVPGLVDDHTGTGVWSANLGWRDLPARQLLSERFEVPVAFGHDVRAGLLGEQRHGAVRDAQHALFLAIGTGLASAMMIDGRLVSLGPWTGEVGHVVVAHPSHPQQVQVLEQIASAGAIGRRWQELGREGDAQSVAEALAAGEQVAAQVWDEALQALTVAIAPVLAATGIELLLLGGGLTNAGELLLAPVREQLAARLPGRPVDVRVAALGDRAAALGAAELAKDVLLAEANPAGGATR